MTALVRRPTEIRGAQTVVSDLSTISRLADHIGAADAIVHLACTESADRDVVFGVDVSAMAELIRAWRRGPFVYVSSPSVQDVPDGALREEFRLAPLNWYEVGKLTNEFQLRAAAASNPRGPAIIVRPGAVFGTGPRASESHYLGIYYRQSIAGGAFVFDSEEGVRNYGASFIGARDFGRAIAEILHLKNQGTLHVAAGDFTWHGLIETIDRLAGTKSRITIRPGALPQSGEYRPHQSRFFLDTTAFRTATGFQPTETFDDLIAEFVRTERGVSAGRQATP